MSKSLDNARARLQAKKEQSSKLNLEIEKLEKRIKKEEAIENEKLSLQLGAAVLKYITDDLGRSVEKDEETKLYDFLKMYQYM